MEYHYWLQSEWRVFLSAFILLLSEGFIFFLNQKCRSKKEEKQWDLITSIPREETETHHIHTIADGMKKESQKEATIAFHEDIQKREEKAWKIL